MSSKKKLKKNKSYLSKPISNNNDENFKRSKSLNKKLENNNFFDLPLSKILPVGLNNLGASCFMNACLQCFFHCSLFIKELNFSFS